MLSKFKWYRKLCGGIWVLTDNCGYMSSTPNSWSKVSKEPESNIRVIEVENYNSKEQK